MAQIYTSGPFLVLKCKRKLDYIIMNLVADSSNFYIYRFLLFLGSPCNRFSLPITCLLSLVWLFNCVWRIIGERLFVFCSLINCACLTIVNSYACYILWHSTLVITLPAYPESSSTFSKARRLRRNIYS